MEINDKKKLNVYLQKALLNTILERETAEGKCGQQ